MVPSGGVKGGSCEVFDARDVRRLGLGENAGGVDHEAGRQLFTVRGGEAPDVLGLVEGRGLDPGVEADPRADAVAVDAMLGVVLELRARRVDARPGRPLLEGELVAERGDVDADARVGVPMPGSPDAAALLDDQVVVDPGLSQLDRDPDAGESGADHDDLVVGLGLVVHRA